MGREGQNPTPSFVAEGLPDQSAAFQIWSLAGELSEWVSLGLFSSEMEYIGKREVFPLVLHYGGGKAGIEQKRCFQIQNVAHFPNWSSLLLHSNRNWLFLRLSDFGQGLPWNGNVCTLQHLCRAPCATGTEANCMCTANEPRVLYVRQPNWRDSETALVFRALSGPKGQLRVTGLLGISRYASLGRRDKASKTREPW